MPHILKPMKVGIPLTKRGLIKHLEVFLLCYALLAIIKQLQLEYTDTQSAFIMALSHNYKNNSIKYKVAITLLMGLWIHHAEKTDVFLSYAS